MASGRGFALSQLRPRLPRELCRSRTIERLGLGSVKLMVELRVARRFDHCSDILSIPVVLHCGTVPVSRLLGQSSPSLRPPP